MSRTIELVEHETVALPLSYLEAQQLASVAGQAVTVTVADRVGSVDRSDHVDHYQIAAQNWVGTVVAGEVTLLIRPKIRPENLFCCWRLDSRQADGRAVCSNTQPAPASCQR